MIELRKKLSLIMAVWTPRVTVAAIVNNGDQFLLVKEKSAGRIVYNQPAGHLEDNESLIDAVQREMLEETGTKFTPTALVGIYRWQHVAKQRTYLRFLFAGEISSNQLQPQDSDILEALWLSRSEIELKSEQLRSPQVMRGINDYCNGIRYNLDILGNIAG